MDKKVMTNEENYAFDVAGYLHVPGVLSQEEVAALNAALDAVEDSETLLGGDSSHRELFRDLLVHPTLVWYLNQMIGHGFRLDQAPRLLGQRDGEVSTTLIGGDEPRNPSLAYRIQKDRRSCQGVKTVWALEDVVEGDGDWLSFRQATRAMLKRRTTWQPVLTIWGWWCSQNSRQATYFWLRNLRSKACDLGKTSRKGCYPIGMRRVRRFNPIQLVPTQKPSLYRVGQRKQRQRKRRSCMSRGIRVQVLRQ